MNRNISHFALLLLLFSETHSQWIRQPFPFTDMLWRVRFANESTGWILGQGSLYKTSDGGMNWFVQDLTLPTGTVLYCLNDQIVFCSSTSNSSLSSGIRRTANGGLAWQTVDSAQLYYWDMQFADSMIGFAVGGNLRFQPSYPFVRKTTDGGITWTALWTSSDSSSITGVSFVNPLEGWASGYSSKVYHTTNGGSTWTLLSSYSTTQRFTTDIHFVTNQIGWTLGGIIGASIVARTTNGGTTWTYQTFPGAIFHEIQMVNSNVGWIAGEANYRPIILRTTNRGDSWEPQVIVPQPPLSPGYESISMLNETTGWIIGLIGVYKTITGGTTSVSQLGFRTPKEFRLHQNYPNPFNPSTTIEYQLPQKSNVEINIYNSLGQLVRTLVKGEAKEAGDNVVTWDGMSDAGSTVSTGAYFYQVKANGFVQTKKMILIR